MTEPGETVLDASAFVAYLQDEKGAEQVESALGTGAYMSAANWAEVLSKVADAGGDPAEVAARLEREGLAGGALRILPLTGADALEVARLRPRTRARGLSLGDRACLALGAQLGLPVLTTDRTWRSLGLPAVEVIVLR